ncbi:hypothetical protein AVEN_56296-1, partial [Araneus ventricosus]
FNFLERPISLLPDDRETINTRFALFTRDYAKVPMNFSNLDSSLDYLDRSGFNPKINTKFIVPGYMSKVAPHWKMVSHDGLFHLDSGVARVNDDQVVEFIPSLSISN